MLVPKKQLSNLNSRDCCYGGKDGGLAGCEAQIYAENCGQPAYRAAMCFNNGVKASECDADCCSIKDKVGRGCPK